jgi:RHS repeat-associated protein
MLFHSRSATVLMLICLLAQSFLSPANYFASAWSSMRMHDSKEGVIDHKATRNPALDLGLPTEDPLYAPVPSMSVEATANSQVGKEQGDVPLGTWPSNNGEYFGGGNPAELIPTCNCGPSPINSTTGNFWHTFNDLSIPGRGVPLSINRTYNSQAAGALGPLGYGWTFNYNMFASRGLSKWTIQQENGSITFIGTTGAHEPWVHASITTRTITELESFTRTHDQIRHYYRHYSTGGSLYGWDRLDYIVSRNGYTTTLQYEAVPGQQGVDRLASVTDIENRHLTFYYDESSKPTLITRIVDPFDRTLTFAYDSNNNLSTATDVGGKETTFTYDANHRLLTMTDANSGTVTNTYDANSRVLTQTDPLGRALGFEYSGPLDGAGTTTTRMTDTLGLVSIYAYDYRRLDSITKNATAPELERSVTTFTYPPPHPYQTEILSITDPLDHTWNYTWDDYGNVVSVMDPLSRTTSYKYNSANDLTVVTNTLGLTTTLAYDQWGNMTSITRPRTEGNELITTTLTYDPLKHGDVLTVTNPLGKSWGMTYDDTYGYLETTTNPLNETSEYSHNSIGWLLSATDPMMHTSTFTYTTYGEPSVITNNLTYTSTYTYDSVGNIVNVTDANFKTITNTYNLNNELTRATRPDGTHSDYGYDNGGRVITQTNGLGQPTVYTYDDIYRRVTVTDPLNRSSIAAYDLMGNTTVITDAMTQTITLGYDAAYQLRSVDYQDTSTPDVSYDYNNLGMRTVMTDGTGTNLYSYDSLNRPVSIQHGNGRTVTYGYDNGSRLTAIGYPNLGGSGTVTVTRGYNDANRLMSVQDWLSHTNSFNYDLDGKLSGITYANGLTSTLGYNGGDQLTSIDHNNTGTAFLSLDYTPDPVGLLDTSVEVNGTRTSNHDYNYDGRYRVDGDDLTGTTESVSTWLYDAATQIEETTYEVADGKPMATTRTYDAANQLLGIVETESTETTKDWEFTFDNKGNRTQQYDSINSVTKNYGYNQANQLVSLPPTFWTYGYNGDGLRMSKSGSISSEQFTWDVASGLPLLLQDGQASFIYGPGGILLEEVMTSDSSVHYYHQDRLGSVRALTTSTGSVANRYEYDAYGQRTYQTGSAYNPFGFTGEYTDSESGLIYLRARYYDPSTQQFLTRDAFASITEQPYAYVAGSPTNATDPSGHFLDVIVDVGFILWDIGDIAINGANEENTTALALDAAGALIPFATGLGAGSRVARAVINHGDDVARAVNHADDGIHAAKQLGRGPGPTVDPNTGHEVGRFIVDPKGNAMIEPKGGSCSAYPPSNPNSVDTHTYYPNGSNYQRLNPEGHGSNPTPHGHGHLPGTGPGKKGQGPSLDPLGNIVPINSPDAHWPVR